MTAYPSPGEGIARRMIVRDLEEHCLGLEGWIYAETESEVPISFFARAISWGTYVLADGSKVPSETFRIRTLKSATGQSRMFSARWRA